MNDIQTLYIKYETSYHSAINYYNNLQILMKGIKHKSISEINDEIVQLTDMFITINENYFMIKSKISKNKITNSNIQLHTDILNNITSTINTEIVSISKAQETLFKVISYIEKKITTNPQVISEKVYNEYKNNIKNNCIIHVNPYEKKYETLTDYIMHTLTHLVVLLIVILIAQGNFLQRVMCSIANNLAKLFSTATLVTPSNASPSDLATLFSTPYMQGNCSIITKSFPFFKGILLCLLYLNLFIFICKVACTIIYTCICNSIDVDSINRDNSVLLAFLNPILKIILQFNSSVSYYTCKPKLLIAKQQLDLIDKLYNKPSQLENLRRIYDLNSKKILRKDDVLLILYINNLSNIINTLGDKHKHIIHKFLLGDSEPPINLIGFDLYYKHKYLKGKL